MDETEQIQEETKELPSALGWSLRVVAPSLNWRR